MSVGQGNTEIHHFSFVFEQISLELHRIIVLISIYNPAKFQIDLLRNKRQICIYISKGGRIVSIYK